MALLFVASAWGVLCSYIVWIHLIFGVLVVLLWIHCGLVGHDSGHYQIMLIFGTFSVKAIPKNILLTNSLFCGSCNCISWQVISLF